MDSTTVLLILLLLCSISFIPSTVGSNVIEVPRDYSRIQMAIDEANLGDTIKVASGTYFESLKITKPLSLIGEGSDNTVIVGSGTIILVSADNVELRGFTVRNGTYGIFLWSCSGALLRNNTMSDNTWNFAVSGDSLSHFVHDVDSSNMVDGKPIYFWVNENDKRVPKDAGYVALINSTNVTAEDLSLTSNEQGVLLVNTKESVIRNVTISGNDVGIDLHMSSNNTITMNSLNTINWLSLYLVSSCNNTLTENTIRKGDYGISTMHSNGNTIYHNNFIDNKVQQYHLNSSNKWDNGEEGNYWSDYKGEDLNSDGVGDTLTPHLGVDYYPLVNIFDNIPPTADAGNGQTVFKNAAVLFNASSATDNIGIVDYKWDFGDGSKGSSMTTNHVYEVAGVYTVTLTVTDVSGNIATDVILITVVDPPVPFVWWILFAVVGTVAIIFTTSLWLRRHIEKKGIKNKS